MAGETVVTYILPEFKDKVQGIEVGDVILAVDGEDIAVRRERLGKYFAASTPQALLWRIHQNILGGSKDSVVRLRVRNRSGKIEELSLVRNSPGVRSSRTSPVFSVLPEGFGYIDLARLTVQQVPEAFEAIDPKANGEVFNIGSEEAVTVMDVAKAVKAKTGSASEIVQMSYRQAYGGDFEDIRYRVPDRSPVILSTSPLSCLGYRL